MLSIYNIKKRRISCCARIDTRSKYIIVLYLTILRLIHCTQDALIGMKKHDRLPSLLQVIRYLLRRDVNLNYNRIFKKKKLDAKSQNEHFHYRSKTVYNSECETVNRYFCCNSFHTPFADNNAQRFKICSWEMLSKLCTTYMLIIHQNFLL